MNMQARKYSRARAQRAESYTVASELPPKSLVEEVTRLLLPHESKTPRGTQPSRRLKRNIDQMRSGKDSSVTKVLTMLWFRRARNEPAESVSSALVVVKASLREGETADDLTLAEMDDNAEARTRIARTRYFADPCTMTARAYLEAEAAEAEITERIVAGALRFVEAN